MATVSSLSAPGVEVREYDNSLRISNNTGTTVFVPGYAAQGPVEEVIQIGSITDFENVYGIPTNDAERYFYYTCLAILNNSGLGTTLLTSRLPYGSGNISGVIVHERFPRFDWRNAADPAEMELDPTLGRIGTYQIRHQVKEDIWGNMKDDFDPDIIIGIKTYIAE